MESVSSVALHLTSLFLGVLQCRCGGRLSESKDGTHNSVLGLLSPQPFDPLQVKREGAQVRFP
jgi:hypothetical protein